MNPAADQRIPKRYSHTYSKSFWLSGKDYLFHAPGFFYHIGGGYEEPLHSLKFSPDERCLKTAVAMTVKFADAPIERGPHPNGYFPLTGSALLVLFL